MRLRSRFERAFALPQVAVDNVVGVIDQRGRKRLDAVAFGGRRCLGHASLPCSSNAARRGAAFCVAEATIKISLPSPNRGVDQRKPPAQARAGGESVDGTCSDDRYLPAHASPGIRQFISEFLHRTNFAKKNSARMRSSCRWDSRPQRRKRPHAADHTTTTGV